MKALADAAQLVSTLCGGAFFMTPCPLLWGMDLSAATLDALRCLQGPTTHFTSLPFGSCVHLFTDMGRAVTPEQAGLSWYLCNSLAIDGFSRGFLQLARCTVFWRILAYFRRG